MFIRRQNFYKDDLPIYHSNNLLYYTGWTPLHLATYFGHKDVMELLLSRGADINALNEMGDTSLHKAAFIGRQVFFE